MELLRQVFTQGVRLALRRWRLLLPLYVVGLVFGLIQTWPLLSAGRAALYNPFLRELAAGSGEAVTSLLLSDTAAVGAAAGTWALVALLLTLMFGLAYNFFSGGMLSVLTERGAFWEGCRRWFWSFTGLGALLVVLALVALAVAAAFGALLGGVGVTIIALLLTQLVNALGEYARALAVVQDRRNPFALLGMAVRFLRRNLVGVLALALAGLLLHAALALVYSQVAGLFGGSPVVVVWQQAVALAWLWVKLLRLAWAAIYARLVGEATAPVEGALPAAA